MREVTQCKYLLWLHSKFLSSWNICRDCFFFFKHGIVPIVHMQTYRLVWRSQQELIHTWGQKHLDVRWGVALQFTSHGFIKFNTNDFYFCPVDIGWYRSCGRVWMMKTINNVRCCEWLACFLGGFFQPLTDLTSDLLLRTNQEPDVWKQSNLLQSLPNYAQKLFRWKPFLYRHHEYVFI